MFQRLVEYSITTTDDIPFDVGPCLLPYEPSWFADAHPQLQSAVGPVREWHSFALLASMLLSFDAGAQWYVDVLSYNFAVLDDADLPLGTLRVTGSDQFGAVYVFVPVVYMCVFGGALGDATCLDVVETLKKKSSMLRSSGSNSALTSLLSIQDLSKRTSTSCVSGEGVFCFTQ